MNGRSIFKSYHTYLSCIFSFPWGLSFSVRSISIGVRAFIQIRITFSKGCNSRCIRNKIAETRINICTSYVWIILSIFRILKRDKIFTHFYDIFDQHLNVYTFNGIKYIRFTWSSWSTSAPMVRSQPYNPSPDTLPPLLSFAAA